MSRRTENAATQAAEEASAAARVLQERSQEAQAEKRETLHLPKKAEAEQKAEAKAKPEVIDNDRVRQIPRGNIHRDEMMEEIREKRGENKPNETTEAVENKGEVAKDAATQQEKTVDTAAEATASTEVAAAETTVETPIMVEMVKVKVDGEESQVPKAAVDAEGGIVAYQINRASERRLKQTNEALAETRRTQAALAEWAKQQKPAEPQITDDQFIATKIDAIRFGSSEESSAALREVIARANPRQDSNAIVMQATVNMQHNLAQAKYRSDYQDVFANPVLKIAAEAMERQELSKYVGQHGPDWQKLSQLDWTTFYGTIGTQVRNAAGPRPHQPAQSGAAASGGNTSQLSEKEARKASIVEPPKAAAARAASKEEPTLTPEEARQSSLREMRKSRGLPVD